MGKYDIQVQRGQVRIESVGVRRSGRGYLEMIIGTNTKRPVVNYWANDGPPVVYLYTDDQSLRGDPRYTTPTEITFPAYTRGWEIHGDYSGRYTIVAVAYRSKRYKYLTVWREEEKDE